MERICEEWEVKFLTEGKLALVRRERKRLCERVMEDGEGESKRGEEGERKGGRLPLKRL